MSCEGGERARASAEAVARKSYGKLVAYLAAQSRDVAGAEDALSDAFAAALGDWPVQGIPQSPEAWLMTVAKRRMIDAARRRLGADQVEEHLGLIAEELAAAADSGSDLPDHRLALMFACAHPAIEPVIRTPLILQTILGFDAVAIGSAFLISPAAMSQRLVRAKQKISQAGVPFRVPERAELCERLDAVLEAVYAAFAQGWSDATGSDARLRDLAEEGIWLGRITATLLPDEPEALGLLALMLHAEARRAARRTRAGEYVPLAAQDPTMWDARLIDEAEELLLRASTMGRIGRFQIEAAIQSAHAARKLTGRTDWPAILALYDALLSLTGSMVVAINRAVALSEIEGPKAALAALEGLSTDRRIVDYQPYWAARAGLLARSGEHRSAGEAYDRAIGLESDPAVRAFLQRQRAMLAG